MSDFPVRETDRLVMGQLRQEDARELLLTGMEYAE